MQLHLFVERQNMWVLSNVASYKCYERSPVPYCLEFWKGFGRGPMAMGLLQSFSYRLYTTLRFCRNLSQNVSDFNQMRDIRPTVLCAARTYWVRAILWAYRLFRLDIQQRASAHYRWSVMARNVYWWVGEQCRDWRQLTCIVSGAVRVTVGSNR